jgi:hypothetical protein
LLYTNKGGKINKYTYLRITYAYGVGEKDGVRSC